MTINMIVFEDEALEDFAVNGDGDIAVPIEFFVPDSGEIIITAYHAAFPTAEEFEKRFSGDPFGEQAAAFLSSSLTPLVNEWGYIPDKLSPHIIQEYIFANDKCPDRTNIKDGTVLICTDRDFEKYENLTERDTEFSGDELDVMFAYTENGKILSFAAVNDTSYDDDSIEINVETGKPFRRRGYAVSCVTALTSYLISKGMSVRYNTALSNTASIFLARKAGFDYSGTRSSFVCYHI